MMRVTYAGVSFDTSDVVADSLLRFVATLWDTHDAEALTVPSVDDEGTTVFIKMAVGPASEIIAIPVASPFPEPDPDGFLTYLLERTRDHAGPRPISEPSATASYDALDWDGIDTF